LDLHQRLRNAEPTATADFFRAYLQPLLEWTGRRYPRLDVHLCESAVHDAVLNYVRRPETYRPERSDLAAYLRMAVRGDLRNLLHREQRHHRHRVRWELVEEADAAGNVQRRHENPALHIEAEEEGLRQQTLVRAVVDRCTEPERRVLDLMLAGERRTPVYAEVLGLGGATAEQQERGVKTVKDRLKKRLEREALRHG
jgi:RNA polymerase sigma factor (sigma-70 family)